MWNIAFFHTLDPRLGWSPPQDELELFERLRRPPRDHFHGPVALVAHEPAQSQPVGLAPHEPAEPHSLHPAVHKKSQRDHRGRLTPAAPVTPAAGATRRTPPR